MPTFFQELHKFAEDCEYGPLKKDLIRDRIVVSVFDDALSNELQAKADLTLDQAVQISRQAEERKESQYLIRGESAAVNAVGQSHPKETHFSSTPQKRCGYCSKEYHPRHKCPAREVTCSSCHKKGHYQAVCRSAKGHTHLPRRTVQDLSEEDFYDSFEDEEEFFLGHIFHIAEDNCWTAEIFTNGNPTLSDWTRVHQFQLWMKHGPKLMFFLCPFSRSSTLICRQANSAH